MSVKKDLGVIFGLFFIVVLLLVFGGANTTTVFLDKKEASTSASAKSTLVIRDLTVELEVANNFEKRKLGLGGRESLDINRGMLFVFDKSDVYTFWMKGMKFALDILWLDENKKVVFMAQDVPSEPGKKDSELKKYTPTGPAKYVLEINAGLSKVHSIQVGDTATFPF